MSKPPRAKVRTTNGTEYNAAGKRRGSLMVWRDPDLPWQAGATGRAGRPAVFSDAATPFCLTLKCMFGLGLRQATGLAESLGKLAQLDGKVPDDSTLSRRQKTLNVAITARPSRGGLHLLIDSTGVKMLGEGEWKTCKHGAEYRRQWRKVPLGIDAHTLEIRAIEITDNTKGDAPMLPELLARIPAGERLHSVSADGAYDTRACHEAIACRQAAAILPTRRNAKPWIEGKAGAQVRNEILRTTRKLGRAIWKNLEAVERPPPAQPGGDEDGMLQAPGRAGDGTALRPAGHGAAGAGIDPESVHPPGHAADGARGITPSGVRGSSTSIRFMQQRPCELFRAD